MIGEGNISNKKVGVITCICSNNNDLERVGTIGNIRIDDSFTSSDNRECENDLEAGTGTSRALNLEMKDSKNTRHNSVKF